VGNGHGYHNDAALSLLRKNLRFEFGTVKTTVAPIGANPGPPKLAALRVELRGVSRSASTRAATSTAAPGGPPATSRIGLSGQVCALAVPAKVNSAVPTATATAARLKRRRTG
jgi:hypothetical protein